MNGRPWTAEEVEKLRAEYPTRLTREIAAELGRPLEHTFAAAGRFGLAKSPAFIEQFNRAKKGRRQPGSERGYFPKGHVPHNKGLRMPGWAPGRMRETQFKKGQRSHTWKPVGTILTDNEGYQRIKVRERQTGDAMGWDRNVWPLLHHHVWKQHGRKIPDGHIVVFKDRDRSNCAIENLELISMADNARRNAMWRRLPDELCAAIVMKAALKRKLRKLSGKKQN